MPFAARVTDLHACPKNPSGPILPPGEPTVLICFMPAARLGDQVTCSSPEFIVSGEDTVLIGGKPAARMGDLTAGPNICPGAGPGAIITGCPTVWIGKSYSANVLKKAAETGAPYCGIEDVLNKSDAAALMEGNEKNGLNLDTLGAVVREPVDWPGYEKTDYGYIQTDPSQPGPDYLLLIEDPSRMTLEQMHYMRNILLAYEIRNGNIKTHLDDFMESDIDNYRLLSESESVYHMNGPLGEYNLKFVNNNELHGYESGQLEVVYNTKTGTLDLSPENMPTFNVFGPSNTKGHAIADVAPYWVYKNTPHDSTDGVKRMIGPDDGKSLAVAKIGEKTGLSLDNRAEFIVNNLSDHQLTFLSASIKAELIDAMERGWTGCSQEEAIKNIYQSYNPEADGTLLEDAIESTDWANRDDRSVTIVESLSDDQIQNLPRSTKDKLIRDIEAGWTGGSEEEAIRKVYQSYNPEKDGTLLESAIESTDWANRDDRSLTIVESLSDDQIRNLPQSTKDKLIHGLEAGWTSDREENAINKLK